MKRMITSVVGVFVLLGASAVLAQTSPWGNVLKVAGDVAIQQMTPQAQTVVDQAKDLAIGTAQENFLVTQAKTFLGEKNYQTAWDLANYVITKVNAKSLDAQTIMTDAKAALAKMAQDKVSQMQQGASTAAAAKQVQADAAQTATGIKGLFGGAK